MGNIVTTIIFVRHAQSLHPYSDDRTRPLTEAGMKDRQIVMDTLKDRHIDAFLSSPYKRSVDTIQTTADALGTKIKTDERFRERNVASMAPECWKKDGLIFLLLRSMVKILVLFRKET